MDIDLLDGARIVCDDVTLARRMGCLHPWPDRAWSAVTLTDVLRGDTSGRTDNRQRTVFGAVGLPFQDLVVAWQVFQAAKRRGIGLTLR